MGTPSGMRKSHAQVSFWRWEPTSCACETVNVWPQANGTPTSGGKRGSEAAVRRRAERVERSGANAATNSTALAFHSTNRHLDDGTAVLLFPTRNDSRPLRA